MAVFCVGRGSAALLCATLAVVQVQAQFRAGVQLATVDVLVVDRDGNAISGLGPEDFIVRLGGRERRVVAVEMMTVGAAAVASQPPGAPSGAAFPPPATYRRNVMIVFDDLSFPPTPARELAAGLDALLNTFDDDDLVGVTTTSGRGTTVSPTTDRQLVLNSLRRLAGHKEDDAAPFVIGTDEAFGIERGVRGILGRVVGRECGRTAAAAGNCAEMVESAGRRMAVMAEARADRQFKVIDGVLSAMATLGQPRLVLLMSGGIAADPHRNLAAQVRSLSEKAASHGVHLYALAFANDGVDARDTSAERAQARRADSRFLANGVHVVAEATGGQAFKVVGQAEQVLLRIVSETRLFYRVGVDVAQAPTSREFLDVKVSVRRPDATVRVQPKHVVGR